MDGSSPGRNPEKRPESLPSASPMAALEWERFLSLAEREARSGPAQARLRALSDSSRWAQTPAAARILQQEIQELAGVLDKDGLWGPLTDLDDPGPALDALAKGGTLEIQALAELRRWLTAVDAWFGTPREEIRAPLLRQAVGSLADADEPLRLLHRVLAPDGSLSENASPKLLAITGEMRALKTQIQATIEKVVRKLAEKGHLQGEFSDLRDGRYVIPVKSSARAEVAGEVTDASVSRQTVFMEPAEVAPMNALLRRKESERIQEVIRILEDTSEKLRPHGPALEASVAILVHWDFAQARARFGRRFGGKPVSVVDAPAFRIRGTAHPLLGWSIDAKAIVRNDLEFGGETARVLLITGPNTGGKTVLLKTLGLAGICARTGFPFPASEQPQIGFFEGFLADLGDAQSLEASVSSFSGHVLAFKRILESATPRSLVLLDELNTATDPEEGAALGRAFLETLMDRGALVVTTTHDPMLKALATLDPRVVNAAMEFDEGSRAPTFRLRLGTPGRSRAIETAERLGLPAALVAKARGYLSRAHADFEATLKRLEEMIADQASIRTQALEAREEAERLRRLWTERARVSVDELLEKARAKLRRVVEQAQDQARESLKTLGERRTRREAEAVRGALVDSLSRAQAGLAKSMLEEAPELAEAMEGAPAGGSGTESRPGGDAEAGPLANTQAGESPPGDAPAIRAPGVAGMGAAAEGPQSGTASARASSIGGGAGKPSESSLAAGTLVRVPRLKNVGTVASVSGSKVKVKLGNLQMLLSIDEVEPVGEAEAARLRQSSGSASLPGKPARPSPVAFARPAPPPSELDIRGERLDDALSSMESYLDLAFRSGARAQVTIIHGLGTGALREGIRAALRKSPYVKAFRDGGLGAGGSGATLVELDV